MSLYAVRRAGSAVAGERGWLRRVVGGLTLTGGLLLLLGGTAVAYTPVPAQVYAPYYETYLAPNTPSITATAEASGAKYFTLAFLQSTGKGVMFSGLERQLRAAT